MVLSTEPETGEEAQRVHCTFLLSQVEMDEASRPAYEGLIQLSMQCNNLFG